MAKNRVPITRINKFFGSDDFNLQERMGMEYLHGNLNFTLVLLYARSRRTCSKQRIVTNGMIL